MWNWAVKKIDADTENGIYYTAYDLKGMLRGHSQRMGMSAHAIQGTAGTAHTAWDRYFRGLSRRPRLKGRRRPLSSIAFDHWTNTKRSRIRGSRVVLPGLGEPMRFHRQEIPAGRVGQARVVKRASGWYLCLFVQADPQPIAAVSDWQVGIDPGFSSLLTLSTGEKIAHPHELARAAKRIGQAKRGRRTKLASRLDERVRNRRRNRNHHLSRRLVSENALIAFSADQHHKIARRFGKSVASAGHHQLRQMLSYKSSLIGGRQYIEVSSRNSTRTCSACGALTGPAGWAGLKVREWDCGACGAHHDRDVNAAVNTLVSGLGTSHESSRKAASGIAL